MPCELVDQQIRLWANENSLSLFDSFAETEARFCYVSSAQGECLQIVVEPPEAGMVRVHVWDVETVNDEELHMEWRTATTDLRRTLDTAFAEARAWLERHGAR